jgi:hypothetical protein
MFSCECPSTADSKTINENNIFQKFRPSKNEKDVKKEELIKRKLFYKSNNC